MTGADVREVQQALIAKEFDLGQDGADEIFRPVTDEAIKSFQKQANLRVNGIVGSATRAAQGLDYPINVTRKGAFYIEHRVVKPYDELWLVHDSFKTGWEEPLTWTPARNQRIGSPSPPTPYRQLWHINRLHSLKLDSSARAIRTEKLTRNPT